MRNKKPVSECNERTHAGQFDERVPSTRFGCLFSKVKARAAVAEPPGLLRDSWSEVVVHTDHPNGYNKGGHRGGHLWSFGGGRKGWWQGGGIGTEGES